MRARLICPECGEPAIASPPQNWPSAWGSQPNYSHTDGEPLCPVMTATGYQPTNPTASEDTP
jgi:hypothetical protein